MKQVIVRLRDCRTTHAKTIRIRYYYTQSQYEYEVFDDFKDLMPGQEIYVKIGNRYATWISYEEAEDAVNSGDFKDIEEYIYCKLLDNYSLDYHIEDYLPY